MTDRPTRRRRWPWTLGALGIVLVVLVQLGGGILRADWTEQQIARVLEAGIEHATGERAVVGSLEILPSRGRVEVDGLVLSHISDEPEYDGATILAVDHIGVQLQPRGGEGWVGLVEIVRPVLRLHVDDDGLRELREGAVGGSTRFPWSGLTLTHGTVVVDLPRGQIRVEDLGIESVEGATDRYDVEIGGLVWEDEGVEERAEGVRFAMVHATPKRLVLPEIDLRSQSVQIVGNLAAIDGGPVGGNVSISLKLDALNPWLESPKRLEGLAHLDIGLSGTTALPQAEGALLLERVVLHSLNHSGAATRAELPRAHLSWRHDEGWLRVDEGLAQWGGGEVTMSGSFEPVSSAVELSVSLEGISLAEAIRQYGGSTKSWATFTGDGELSLSGTAQPLSLSGPVDLAMIDLLVNSGPLAAGRAKRLVELPRVRLRGDLSMNPDGVRLHASDLVAGATSGEIDAWLGFSWFGPLEMQLEMDRVDLSTFRPLGNLDVRGRGQIFGRVYGPLGRLQYSANAAFRDFSMIGFPLADQVKSSFACTDSRTLEFTDLKALVGQTRYQGEVSYDTISPSLDISLDIVEGRVEDILGIVDVDVGVLEGDVRGSIALTGPPTAMDGDVVLQLQSVDLLGERFAGGELYSWMDDGRATIESLSLSRWSGEEGVLVRGTIGEGWATNLDVVATGFHLQRLDALGRLDLPIQGRLSIDARIGGTLMAPEPHGRLAVRESWFAGHSVPDSTLYFDTAGELMQIEGHLLGTGMSFDGHIGMDSERSFRGVASLDRFPLHTVLPAAVDGSDVKAWLSGRVLTVGELIGDGRIAHVDARGTALDFEWYRHRLSAVRPWTFKLDGRQLAMEGLALKGGGTRLMLDARTGKDGRVHWAGGGRLDLDLARLAVPGLDRADGGAFVNIFTSAPDQGLVVDVATCGATIQGGWFPHAIEDLHGVIRGTRAGYSLRSLEPDGADAAWVKRAKGLRQCRNMPKEAVLQAQIGGGQAEVQGVIDARAWVPRRFDLTGTLNDGQIAYLDFLPAASGDAALSFNGLVGEDLLLSGELSISEMMFSERIEWEDWLLQMSDEWLDSGVTIDEEPLFAMDLQIDADETVRMRNNVADLTASGSLRVVGDTVRPGLVGSIRAIPGGRVHLKEREFELERGELRFVDPLAYDPNLDIVLKTDVRTREQTYDVEYRVLGTYEDWRAETSSQPSLSSADINALLLFGMTRDQLERYGGLGGVLAVEGGDLLASKMFLSGRVGRERGGIFSIVDPLRPDRLDLVSGVSERGSGTLSSDLRLLYENELDDLGMPGTLMIFEQNLTRVSDTYLGLEQRLARTLFGRTYWASEQHGRHLAIGGAYGLEMKVRWELD